MTRRGHARIAVVAVLAVAAAAFAFVRVARRATSVVTAELPAGSRVDDDAWRRLRAVPFFRGMLRVDALRSVSLSPGGTVDVDLDLTALVRPRLVGRDLQGLCALLPPTARGRVQLGGDGRPPGEIRRESWLLSGPAPLLDLLDRGPAHDPTIAWDSVPGSPSAVAGARLNASRLAEPELGGAPLAAWRERADLAEKILGRPVRAEIAEDLAGPIVVALYERSGREGADALVVVELKRADRLRALVDTVFALSALTERGTIRRYRDVPTGSFRVDGRGTGLALAVDGPVFLASSSRPLLESAIDARRAPGAPSTLVRQARGAPSAWNAVASSAFVAHGWARLARAADPADGGSTLHAARLIPEGDASWRLEGDGPAPAITADPVLPFLRSVFGDRQREGG